MFFLNLFCYNLKKYSTTQKSLNDEEQTGWMYDVELAENSSSQNLEIIYNNNQVYFKTIKPVFKFEFLKAFPSKDLEISLGLQFIPISSGWMLNFCIYQFSFLLKFFLDSFALNQDKHFTFILYSI
jgi:hypothetical protein